MYQVEVSVKRAATPYRVSGLLSEDRAVEVTESVLAAWGLPSPDASRPRGTASIAEQLAETGEYVSEAADYRVAVKRTTR